MNGIAHKSLVRATPACYTDLVTKGPYWAPRRRTYRSAVWSGPAARLTSREASCHVRATPAPTRKTAASAPTGRLPRVDAAPALAVGGAGAARRARRVAACQPDAAMWLGVCNADICERTV